MFDFFFNTEDTFPGLIVRLTIGCIMIAHGSQKLLGLFGGDGFKNTMYYFTKMMHVPYWLGLLVITTEFFGSICLILGLVTKFWAMGMICLMSGILIVANHVKIGFFMNWTGKQEGEGFEYHLLIIGLAITLLFTGGGAFSADWLIYECFKN